MQSPMKAEEIDLGTTTVGDASSGSRTLGTAQTLPKGVHFGVDQIMFNLHEAGSCDVVVKASDDEEVIRVHVATQGTHAFQRQMNTCLGKAFSKSDSDRTVALYVENANPADLSCSGTAKLAQIIDNPSDVDTTILAAA